jgi:hypothetical protein
METAIVSLICIALIVFGGMTMSQGFITSVDASTTGLEEVSQRDETMIRTELTPTTTNMPSANTLELTLENTGQTKLSDFEAWDIIVQYYDGTGTYHVQWLPYTGDTLGDNEWEVVWIRLNGGNEIFEPGVLNPEETMMVRAQLNPSAGANTTNMVVTSTPCGVTASTYFSP